MELPLSQIDATGENLCRDGETDISSLKESMERYGLQQPVIIDANNRLVAGFRRFRAATELGWETIKVTVTDQDPDIVNLIENLERQDLTFYEECLSIRRLYPECTDSEVAASLGRTRSWARPRVKVWTLPEDIIERVKVGKVTSSQVTMVVNAKDKKIPLEKIRGATLTTTTYVTKKKIQEWLTVALEREVMDAVHAFRLVLGDISEEQFWDEVDKDG